MTATPYYHDDHLTLYGGDCRAVKAGSPEGGTVLDPFTGSGTTLLVAQALGRKGIGIDLNPEYLEQAMKRNHRAGPIA